jgi:hypothetical protein
MSQTTHTQPGQAPPPSLATLPPNILALLQQTAQAAQQQQQQQQQQQPPQYGMPPPMINATAPIPSVPPMNPNAQPGYQQLMAYLVSQDTPPSR